MKKAAETVKFSPLFADIMEKVKSVMEFYGDAINGKTDFVKQIRRSAYE